MSLMKTLIFNLCKTRPAVLFLILFSSCQINEQGETKKEPILNGDIPHLNSSSLDSTIEEESEKIEATNEFSEVEDYQLEKIKGVGLVSVDYDSTTILKLYGNIEDTLPKDSLVLFNDININSWNIIDLKEKKEDWFMPYRCHLDYSMLIFQLIQQKGIWLEIIVDERDDRSFWLKKNSNLKIISWENYLLKSSSIEPLFLEENPPRRIPSEEGQTIYIEDYSCLAVKKVTGDWLQMKNNSSRCPNEEVTTSYIRWRKNNELLVEIF